MVVPPPSLIDQLAERIEDVYLRRRPRLRREYARSRVWSVAAEGLVSLHHRDVSLPIDPELFVAIQLNAATERMADPWVELVHPTARSRYRREVRRLVRGLRRELRGEIRLIRHRLDAGVPWDEVFGNPCSRISPLARYVVAYLDRGAASAGSFTDDVCRQHDSCPLYRQAVASLLPLGAYPVPDESDQNLVVGPVFSLN